MNKHFGILAVLALAVAVFAAEEKKEEDIKTYKRLIPADVLRGESKNMKKMNNSHKKAKILKNWVLRVGLILQNIVYKTVKNRNNIFLIECIEYGQHNRAQQSVFSGNYRIKDLF